MDASRSPLDDDAGAPGEPGSGDTPGAGAPTPPGPPTGGRRWGGVVALAAIIAGIALVAVAISTGGDARDHTPTREPFRPVILGASPGERDVPLGDRTAGLVRAAFEEWAYHGWTRPDLEYPPRTTVSLFEGNLPIRLGPRPSTSPLDIHTTAIAIPADGWYAWVAAVVDLEGWCRTFLVYTVPGEDRIIAEKLKDPFWPAGPTGCEARAV